MTENSYEYFLTSKTASKWKKFGAVRRSGVLAPLFSLFSAESIGIGELPDLKLLADWCVKCGMSIIQLLPLNDTGFDFAPYSCQSTFALEPMYLRLSDIRGVEIVNFQQDINIMKSKCEAGQKKVNYKIKKLKLKLLLKMFNSIKVKDAEFETFKKKNMFWLNDYAVYKVLKDKYEQKTWEEWEEQFKNKEVEAIKAFIVANEQEVDFNKWLQWQIFLQFAEVKSYSNAKGIYIQGDLPFLVARDSADVWSNQSYFKLDVSSGAPSDMYFAKGQRWGMPTYNWERIEANGFDYLKEKVKFAQNFYDMFRIDHFVGLFRLWTIKLTEPEDTYGLNGYFDPNNEADWKRHGQKVLKAMTENTDMLPCAEDLGVVPACSYETLKEFAIPGMDVQRWTRNWGNTYDFKTPEKYRENAIAIISSHDMSPLILWWANEASTVDAMLVEKVSQDNGYDFGYIKNLLFDKSNSTKLRLRWKKDINSPNEVLKKLNKSREEAWIFYDMHRESYDEKQKFWNAIGMEGEYSQEATKDFVTAALKKINSTKSIFAIQLLQDWLSLGNFFDNWKIEDLRVNTPGTTSDENWSIVMPMSLEELLVADINKKIKKINIDSGRV